MRTKARPWGRIIMETISGGASEVELSAGIERKERISVFEPVTVTFPLSASSRAITYGDCSECRVD